MEKNNIENAEVKIEGNFLVVTRKNKVSRFELKKISSRLADATEEELKQFTVSASGYGIHWYSIDEDISIPALLNEPVVEYGKKKK